MEAAEESTRSHAVDFQLQTAAPPASNHPKWTISVR